MSPDPVRVVLWRGDLAESEHRVRVAVWRDGRLAQSAGDVDSPVYLRSSAKPVQALASVVTGAADRFSMTEAELALACGSHGGEPFHTETALGLLRRLELGPEHLQCGAHPPSYEPAARDLVRHGVEPSALHNNCSGKHSNMLAACVAMGWPVESYLEFHHPLQVMNVAHLAALAGVKPREITLGIDGCSAPNFALPLRASARAFAVWANPGDAPDVPDVVREAALRIAAALAAHPEMIGGTRRVDTDLIRVTGGRVISKMGAEGVWCLGVAGAGIGIAMKTEDGAGRAPFPVGLALLRHLGVLSDTEWDALSAYHDPVLRNHRRLAVGRVEVVPPSGV
jgi:L-asparaginase II